MTMYTPTPNHQSEFDIFFHRMYEPDKIFHICVNFMVSKETVQKPKLFLKQFLQADLKQPLLKMWVIYL